MSQDIISVSQLNGYLKALIDRTKYFSDIYVRGEISNFTNHYKTGHFYLTLKDDKSLIRAVMFRGNAQKLAFIPENGMKVLVRGRVAVFERDGQYQIYLSDMQPDGIGSLHIAFEQLKGKLQAEGLFDPEKKLPIPRMPMRVGVITSPTGAAVRDIIHVAGRRFPLAHLYLYPVLVQGEGAPAQLCAALDYFETQFRPDVIIIGRGGGSLEELWAFNHESLARVISAMTIPVISAVGHETDFTICDFVSDLRAPTPSAAAEISVPDQIELRRQLLSETIQMITAANSGLERRKTALEAMKQRLSGYSPAKVLDDRRMQCAFLLRQTHAAMELKLAHAQSRFSELSGILDAMSPLKTLERGYAIVCKGETSIHRAASLETGDMVSVKMRDGAFQAEVKSVLKKGGAL